MKVSSFIIAGAVLFSLLGAANATCPYPPPTKYNHEYKGTVIHKVYPQWMLWFKCGMSKACAFEGSNYCVIYYPEEEDLNETICIIEHEIAHCNGWHWSHPND